MARMHARKKGKSGSHKPVVKVAPEWLTKKKDEIEKIVIDMAKDGKTASEIGRVLRDQHGVPSTKVVCGKTITQIMKENKLEGELPEDMLSLIKKAVFLRKHLEKNPRDTHNKKGLMLIESKIKRLQKYYKKIKVLAKTFYYKPEEAALLVK